MVGKKSIRALFVQYFFVVLMCLIILVPIMILIIASFKDNAEFGSTGMFAFAQNPTWNNYVQVLKKAHILVAFKASAERVL